MPSLIPNYTYVRRSLLTWLGLCLWLLSAAMPLHSQSVASPTHTVAAGESLSAIALRYAIPLDELMALNSIADPDAIVAGQILVLPTTPAATPPPVEVDPVYAAAEDEPATHVVQPGDTLSSIAQAYALDPDELMALNGITDPDTVVIGQRLRLTPPVTTGQALDAGALPTGSGNPVATLNEVYTVELGDTLELIALRFGVDAAALRQINRLARGAPLSAGQSLILPATPRELVVTPAQPDPTAAAAYVVASGDSLSVIAQANGLSLAELMAANQIDNPDTVYVGQRLSIPSPAPPVDETASASPVVSTAPRSGFYFYTVKPGDTLSTIAREFDSTMLAIMEYNDLPDTETVYLGLELRIPYGPPPLFLDAPPVPPSGTRFIVSLSRQQCWVMQGERIVHAWQCSTGYGEWITRTGDFAVQTKLELAKSTAYRLDMPYWLGIYDVGAYENGIHGLPVLWDTGEKLWTGLVGQPATFGCAMLDDEDAARLFDLAYLGMPVHIVP
jgi:LysM repeat protein